MILRQQFERAGALAVGVGALALVAVLLAPKESHAKGFILITYGDDISHVADIPAQVIDGVKQSTGAASPAIGIKYQTFGFFYLNIWTWSGEYVVFENDTYWDLGAEGAAQMLGVTVDDLPKPFTYTFPPGLIVLLVLGIGFALFVFVFGRKEDDPPAPEQNVDDDDDDDDDDD